MRTSIPAPTGRPDRRRARRAIGAAAAVALSLGAVAACADNDTFDDDPTLTDGGDGFGDDGMTGGLGDDG